MADKLMTLGSATTSVDLKVNGDVEANKLTITSINNSEVGSSPKFTDTVLTETDVSNWGFTKNTGTYSKPSTGIPKTDLASGVQTSLGKADTALQSSAISDMATKTWVGQQGYKTTDTNTTYTFAEGSTNGAFSVTPSGGSATSVKVHGLGSAAYTASTDYASSSHNHAYLHNSTSNTNLNWYYGNDTNKLNYLEPHTVSGGTAQLGSSTNNFNQAYISNLWAGTTPGTVGTSENPYDTGHFDKLYMGGNNIYATTEGYLRPMVADSSAQLGTATYKWAYLMCRNVGTTNNPITNGVFTNLKVGSSNVSVEGHTHKKADITDFSIGSEITLSTESITGISIQYNTTISASTKTISKTGYTPLGIVGWYWGSGATNIMYANVFNLYLSSRTSGSATLNYRIRNMLTTGTSTTNIVSGTLNALVLWVKG